MSGTASATSAEGRPTSNIAGSGAAVRKTVGMAGAAIVGVTAYVVML